MNDAEVIAELQAGNRLLKQEHYKLLEKNEKLDELYSQCNTERIELQVELKGFSMRHIKMSTAQGVFKMFTEYGGKIEKGSPLYLCDDGTVTPVENGTEVVGSYDVSNVEVKEEQPNCEGCEFFKHPNKFHHCWRYTQETSLCKLQQEPVEQPPTGKLLPWQQSLLNDYDQKRFLELIERYNHKLSGVWDKDFTINGERLLEIISLGWGATFSLDRSEAENKKMKGAPGILQQISDKLQTLTGEQNVWKAIVILETSRKELLAACKRGCARLLEMGQTESSRTVKILNAAIEKANKEGD